MNKKIVLCSAWSLAASEQLLYIKNKIRNKETQILNFTTEHRDFFPEA